MFKVTVVGEYVISGKLAQIDEYEEVFELDIGDKAEARAYIQNSGVLEKRLAGSKKNFKRWRTCQVVDIEEVRATKENKIPAPQKKLEKLLIEATKLGCIPYTLKKLRQDDTKIKHLEEAITKKKARIKKLNAADKKAQKVA